MAELPARFGPYQVIDPLGAGGMGQVYRARDTRLQRFVAIKILHDGLAVDPDRQRRFAQEAVAASALNHPNILTVYDIGHESDVQYIVSELIEGESLRTEMNRGHMPIRRAVEIAQQVAEGLAAAHDAGIVHRDLKPENVMVMADGRVKIVDFGLAKSLDGEAALAGGVGATQTAEGLILGTVPYMSPEQARGAAADFRSDQFALGVMLYELMAGTHPFKRETSVQTLSAIIAEDPPDPAQANPLLPVAVRWLIRRLLAKAPRQRFAHTADLAADLRTIRDYLSEATTTGATAPVIERPPSRWVMKAAIGAVLGALLVGAGWSLAPASEPSARFTPFAADFGYQSSPAWSPDGTEIAYEAEVDGVVQIFTRKVGSAIGSQLTKSTFDCYGPTWSVDRYIYYHSAWGNTDGLFRVSPVGGNPEPMIQDASRSTISPDGRTVFFLRDQGMGFQYQVWRASLPDLKEERYAEGELKDMAGSSANLKFSPDGKKVLLYLGQTSTRESAGFWEIPQPTGQPRRVLIGVRAQAGLSPAFFTWLVDNRHVIVTRSDGPTPGTHLWLADTRSDRLSPLTVTPGNEGSPSLSPAGVTLAFTNEATDFDLFTLATDGSPLRKFKSTSRNEFDPAASPRNNQYAFVSDRSGEPQIWLENLEGYLREPLVTEADFGVESFAVGALAFSPDGSKLAFQRAAPASPTRPEGSRVWVKSVAGGRPFPVPGEDPYQDGPTWSPNGDWIAYVTGSAERGLLRLVKAQVGGTAYTALNSGSIPPFVPRPVWSPDGAWILCETLDGLSLISPDGGPPKAIAEGGWLAYTWGEKGRMIYGLKAADDLHSFELVSLDPHTGVERVIGQKLGTIPQALQPIRGFSQLPDGRFLTSIAQVRSDIYLLEGFNRPRSWWEQFSRAGPNR